MDNFQWIVRLWIDNEENSYNEALRIGSSNASKNECARALRGMVEENIGLVDSSGLTHDLLVSALNHCNWYDMVDMYSSSDRVRYLTSLNESIES